MPTTKMEFSGKDVNTAIENACQKLNTKRELLDIEIISAGSSGIFGLGRRQAKILVTQKTIAEPSSEEKPVATSPETPGNEASPVAGRQVPPARVRGEFQRNGETKTPRRVKEYWEESEELDELTPEIFESTRAELTKFIDLMGFHMDINLSQQGRKIIARLTGDQVRELVGEEGQVIDSLQYLLRKILSKQFQKKVMITIDAGDYRANRKSELERLALSAAAEVKTTGMTKTIAPLNPAERRVIHVTLQNDDTVLSKSVGDGLFKKIIIFPADSDRKKFYGKRRPPRGPRPDAKKS